MWWPRVTFSMTRSPRFLLLQVRNFDDPMREHEVQCFSRSFRCDRDQIRIVDLLSVAPSDRDLSEADVVLLGGSADYSIAKGGPWLQRLSRPCVSYTGRPSRRSPLAGAFRPWPEPWEVRCARTGVVRSRNASAGADARRQEGSGVRPETPEAEAILRRFVDVALPESVPLGRIPVVQPHP